MPETNIVTYCVIGILVIIFVLIVLISVVLFINDFSSELQRLNMEIGRTTGAERQHYIRRRRRLWLSLLPFVKY